MSFVGRAFLWFLFFFVLGVLAGVLLLSVAAVIKTCRTRRATTPSLAPTELSTIQSVPWTMAVAVTNPDDTMMMAVKEPPSA
jgi:hypothetical protein